MKRTVALLSAGILAASLGITACGRHVAQPTSSAVKAWVGTPNPAPESTNGATLVVSTRVLSDARRVQSVAPYHRADIVRLTLDLWNANTNTIAASIQLTNQQLDNSVTFSALSAQTTYRIVATAYGLDPQGAEIVISDPDLSTTQIVVAADETVGVALTVTLLGEAFSGSGASNINIVDGTYPPTNPTITLATPTPPPLQVSMQGFDSIVTLLSIVGASPGSDYLLVLDQAMVNSELHWFLTFGRSPTLTLADFVSGGSVDVGASWPPADTLVVEPGGGALTVHFEGVTTPIFSQLPAYSVIQVM